MSTYHCKSATCNLLVDFVHGQPAQYQTSHTTLYFCSDMCKDDWTRVNNLLIHAAQGKPIFVRRPSHPRHWYERDG